MKRNKTSKFLIAAAALLLIASVARAGPLNEGFEGTYPPEGWLVVNNDGGSYQWEQTTVYEHTGSYSTRCHYESSSLPNDDWLITPKLSVVANDTLGFWYRTYSASYQESVEVRLSTTTNALDQFTNVLWATQVATSTWTEMKFDLTAYAGQDVYIAFVYKSDYQWYWYIDDVTGPNIFAAGDDMATQSIDNPLDGAMLEGNGSVTVQATVKNAGTNSQSGVAVHLEISDGGSYTYTDVEYTGTLTQDQTEQITFVPDWTVPDAFADYTVKVWTALAGDANADNDTLSIGVSSYPEGYATEGFEDTTFPPADWTEHHTAGTGWVRNTSYPHTGAAAARGSYSTGSHWLITPKLEVTTGDLLKYWTRRYYSGNSDDWFFIEVSTATADTSDFVAVDSIHTDELTYDYVQKTVDLSAYASGKGLVYLAFHYQATGGPYVYVDDVMMPPIYVAAGDMATISIDNPSDGAVVDGNSSVTVQATVQNTGVDPQSNVAVNLEISDGGTYTYTDVEYTGTLNATETEQITFAPDWTVPNALANYTIKVWTALAGDGNPDNDTLVIAVSGVPEGYTVESFETLPFPPEGWAMGPGTNDWARTSGSAHSGSYKARARAQNAWLFTPQLVVESGDGLKYWYRAESASYPTSFYVRLSTSATQEDTSAYTTILADHQNVNSTTYAEGVIDLSPYAALYEGQDKGQVYIAFHRYFGQSDSYYLYLDDVTMPPIYVPPNDMATISIDDLPGYVETGSSTTIKATVQNLGADTASAGVPVKLRIDGPLGYVYTDQEATTVDLATDETEQITFTPDWVAPDTLCNYTVTIWTEIFGDEVADNDTLSQVLTVYRAGGLTESFTSTTFPPPGWTVYAFDGGDQWSRYTTYYHSEPACARIYYDLPNNDWFITPRLKAQDGDKLKFWWRVQSTSYEETVFVRVSTSEDVSDTSAYSIIHTIISNSTSWSLETVDLSSYAGQDIYIAWTYDNYNNYGFAIDDVTGPYFPTQIAVSPDSIYEEPFPDSFFDVYMYIGNVGGGQLDYDIELESAVGWMSVDPTSGSALGGEEDTITVSFNTTGLDGHYYNTIRIISNSGEKQDGDTVEVPVHLWVRLIPGMSVSPDSFAVEVPADGTEDDEMYIENTGSGQLDYEIETEEWGKFRAVYEGEPASRKHGEAFKSRIEKEPEKGMEDSRRGVSPTKGQGGPDAFGYRWIDSDEPGGPVFNWVEINATGTEVFPTDDGNVGPFDIGFTFEFYGVEFTQFRIAANGFVSFTSTSGTLANTYIPNTSEPNNLLALFWDDLRPESGGGEGHIYYEYDGLNRLIIEYDGVIRYGTSYHYTMQIILYSNGKIIYQYKTMEGDRQDEATIGIENADGTDGLEVVYNAYYVHDNMAIRFSAAPSWLVFDPESGSVPVGEEDTIDVTFDATGILSGDFYGAFLITGNDPDNPADTVPAHMTVLSPDMTVSPDSIVSSGTEGAVHHETVNLGNAGPGDLLWSIDESIDWLSAAPSSGTVPAGSPPTAVDLTIDCTSLYAGDYYGELTINNNDPDLYPSITYKVYLHVGPDPAIAVTPDSFYVEIYAGTYRDSTMNIANSGGGHLVFEISTEETSPPKDTIVYDSFEDAVPPTGWTMDPGSGTPGGTSPAYWHQDCSGYYSHTGQCGALVGWGYNLDTWLTTPTLSVGAGAYLEFWWESSFYWHVDPYDNGDLFVKVSTDGGSNWTTLWTFGDSADVVNSGGPWPWENWTMYPCHLDLTGYKGNILIAFHVLANDNADIAIDDVMIDGGVGGEWLVVTPDSGVVDPGTDMDLNVRFDASEILGGEKFGNIIIDHNVPEPKGQTLVPVHMVILGPEYSISPEVLNIDALEGQYTDAYLTVGNYTGQAPLNFEMSDDVPWLEEIPSSGTVDIGNDLQVTVRVDGYQLIPGDYYTEIYVETNDFDEQYDTIPVNVHVGPDPVIRVKPDSFYVEALPGTTKDSVMTIVNDGDGTLSFELSIEDVTPLMSFKWAENQQEIYEILKANEQRVASFLAEQASLSGSGSEQVATGALQRMTADEIMAARQNAAGAGLPGKQDYIKACVLDCWGGTDFNWPFWDYLNANWNVFGDQEIVIDYSTLDFDYIAYHDLVTSEADVLIVSNAWRDYPPDFYWIFTADEIAAITQYCEEGCGLVVTSGTFDSDNAGTNPANFATLLGFDPTETYYWPGWYYGFPFTEFDFIDPSHPVLANMTEPYMNNDPDKNCTTPSSGDWRVAVTTANIIAADVGTFHGAITVDESQGSRRVYWAHIAENSYHWTPTQNDYQLVYNSIAWSGGKAEWLFVSPEAGLVPPHDSTDVTVTFDATDLPGGDWFANIIIDHNAPGKGQTIVPVHLSLLGANFSITPESLVVDILEGQILEDHLFIGNFGGEGDLLYSMTDPVAWLSESPDAGSVPPDDQQDVTVTVDATSLIAGHYYTQITITTNDFNNLEVMLPVHVNVGPDPDIDVDPTYEAGVVPGCQYSVPMMLSNLGGGHLGFDIAVVEAPPMLTGVPQGLDQERVLPAATRTESARQIDKSNAAGLTTSGPGPVNVVKIPSGSGPVSVPRQDIIWDNGGTIYGGNLYSSQFDAVYPFVSQMADDFMFAEDMLVTDVHWWGGFWNGPPNEVEPCDFHIYIYADDGTGNAPTGAGMADPAPTALASYFFPAVSGLPLDPNGFYEYNVALSPGFTASAGVKYWIAIQADFPFPPQWGWTNTSGIQLHQAVQGFPILGTPFWTNVSPAIDVAFYLTGESAVPPCPFTVTPESGIVDPESFQYLTLTFDGTVFEECAEETLTCYLLITSNDPDEPQVTVQVDMWPGRGDVIDPLCSIDAGDVVYLINFVLKGGPAPDPLCMGDCAPSHDGMVDMEDVTYLVQFLYQAGSPPKAAPEIGRPTIIKQQQQTVPQTPTPKQLERK